MYEWLLFDADGTIWDFDAAEVEALETSFREVGIEFHDGHGSRYHSINIDVWAALERGELVPADLNRERFGRLFLEMGVEDPPDPEAFGHQYLLNLAGCAQMMDGARELLDGVAGAHRLALITNGLATVQRPRLEHSGLVGMFDPVVISEEIGWAKPAPEYFDVAFDRMGRPDRSSALVIGDSLTSDIGGGAAYGLDTCWFNPSGKPNDSDVTPTYEISALSELAPIVSA